MKTEAKTIKKKALSNLEKERLHQEAIERIGRMNYSAICEICPRGDHWWQANDEYGLESMQRATAIRRLTKKLVGAAEKDLM